ncbi:NADPH-dependent FMN reductase [Amycolatopsis pithecellobii]|uniref:NADPH-dependent FMN reductase n=1 Tax=Amycolatopsis pithecellobii TaxID=664692 RepID=A0A6N7Z4S4_9PSEU|nr:NAD(P)H-dependent oxidoreductase [Amycolatopsis pithecellobii]MTD55414.1 NADPH-dependent FMN reductase [Amycolatopsis pithecellobii]
MSKLLIVIGSTRPGRVGLPVAEWFAAHAVADGRFEVELADLAELELPLFDEPHAPYLRQYTKAHSLAWSATVDAADAIVIVTAEYNHGYPAPLKNALDYLCHEWRHKPLGFVSYGGIAAGTRAVQQLQQVVVALQMVPAPTAVKLPNVFAMFDEQSNFVANDSAEQAASAMLAELETLNRVLAPLRAPQAAGS